MERESDKHSPRIDDAMAHDVDSLLHGAPEESRSQESRLQEDPAVGPGRRFDEVRPGVGLSDSDLDARAELSRHLATADFPAYKEDLLAAAGEAHAPEEMVETLRGLPNDEAFENVQSVWQALGGNVEAPRDQPE